VIKADLLAEDPSYKITVSEAEMVDISSTIIRNAIASGMDASEWLM
jgi:nicotinic acid mononucleotide adenylyltransferase